MQTQPEPARLCVSLTINGIEKAHAMVLILPPEGITNFEDQLAFEVPDLPFDEAEYGEIVQRLGSPNQTKARRGFRHWLQTQVTWCRVPEKAL